MERELIVKQIIELMNLLTDEERLSVIGEYCKYCGCNDPDCQCWNDE